MKAVRLAAIIAAALVLTALSCSVGVACAQEIGAPIVTSAQLVEHPDRWDGRRVSFTGEAIGSAMSRGSVAWLHLNDDAYGLESGSGAVMRSGYNSGHAVLVPTALAREVSVFGSYRARGDLVRVEGVFRSAAPEHGGDMIIEADTLEVLRAGQPLERPVPAWKLVAVVVLSITTGAALAARRAMRSG